MQNFTEEAVRLFRTKKTNNSSCTRCGSGRRTGARHWRLTFRVASQQNPNSVQILPSLGFHQGFGSSVTLTKSRGSTQNAAMMLYTAKRVKGEEALTLRTRRLPGACIRYLQRRANEFASEIASFGTHGRRVHKSHRKRRLS